jgi:hypothetical protein
MVMQKIVKMIMVGMLWCMVAGLQGAGNLQPVSERTIGAHTYKLVGKWKSESNTVGQHSKYDRGIIHTGIYRRLLYWGLGHEQCHVYSRPLAKHGRRVIDHNGRPEWDGYLQEVYATPLSRHLSTKGYATLAGLTALATAAVAYARPGVFACAFNKIKSLLVG